MAEPPPATYQEQLQEQLLWQQAGANLRKVERYVILTMLLLPTIFILNILKKRYSNVWFFKVMASACYTLVPMLLTYTLGIMDFGFLPTLYTIWSIFLLIAYASLDNLSAFNLEERKGRSKIFVQFLTNFALLALFFYYLPDFKGHGLPVMLVCFVVLLKVVERIIALGHATGATPGIKRNLINMVDYMNKDAHVEADPANMKGFHYLVGPRYSETKDGVIVRGITIENIWECNGSLLSSESGGGDPDGSLKDTCLSFSLFWLLLAKFWGYRLYIGNSKRNASELVLNGLVSGKLGGVERVFRVIEVELSFLHDYFFSKYMVFYLHGFWMKLSFLSFPAIFWWSAETAIGFHPLIKNAFLENTGSNPHHQNPMTTAFVIIVVLSFVEVIQLWMLIASSWFKVALISFYANREMSEWKFRLFDGLYRKVVGGVLRVSQFTGGTILSKPWKRKLDQYILLQSCTSFGVDNHFLSGITTVFGSPSLPKLGRKQGESIVMSESVKKAVVLSLQTNGLELRNGIMSLKGNSVDQDLSWACKLDSDTESILVWHVATSVCEMFPESQQTSIQSTEDREVATTLSKYCAYLLVFSPSLLQVPILEAEAMSDKAIKEARKILQEHVSLCGCGEKVNMYEKLKEYLIDNAEVEEDRSPSLVKKGVKLGELLLTIVGDEDKRWKILAEFWAEMILFMASSNTNEIAHIEKLAEGGEFITHLWALLIHAGIHK